MIHTTLDPVPLLNLIKCNYHMLPATKEYDNKYCIISAHPATGILYITANSPDFISGHVRLRGKDEGRFRLVDYVYPWIHLGIHTHISVSTEIFQ
jgi:hypothetical protein